jgi:hypothetical protein
MDRDDHDRFRHNYDGKKKEKGRTKKPDWRKDMSSANVQGSSKVSSNRDATTTARNIVAN